MLLSQSPQNSRRILEISESGSVTFGLIIFLAILICGAYTYECANLYLGYVRLQISLDSGMALAAQTRRADRLYSILNAHLDKVQQSSHHLLGGAAWHGSLTLDVGTDGTNLVKASLEPTKRIVWSPVLLWPENAQLTLHSTAAINFLEVGAQLGLGLRHGCALTPSGEVYCWGSNASGEIGPGFPNYSNLDWSTRHVFAHHSNIPVKVPLPGRAIQVISGEFYSCALLNSGLDNVYCWGGSDPFGLSSYFSSPAQIDFGGSQITVIGAGADFICGGRTTGGASCTYINSRFHIWGFFQNTYYDGNYNIIRTPAFSVPGFSGAVTKIQGGDDSVCFLLSTGEVYCMGDNRYGQLGSSWIGFSSVAISDYDQCSVYAPNWGFPNFCGSPTATKVTLPEAAQDIWGTGKTTCVRTVSGSVWCWGGDNEFGLLGNGASSDPIPEPSTISTPPIYPPSFVGPLPNFNPSPSPVIINPPVFNDSYLAPPLPHKVILNGYPDKTPSSGGFTAFHFCGFNSITSNIWCLGNNEQEQLAIKATTSTLKKEGAAVISPTAPTDINRIDFGGSFSCVLRDSDPGVWCWGTNFSGQLGRGIRKEPGWFGTASGWATRNDYSYEILPVEDFVIID